MTQTDDSARAERLSVAFVCLGNICRSPMAEAVFRHVVNQQGLSDIFDTIDSFGTGAYHLGESPDSRSARTCKSHGVKVSHKAQQINVEDFHRFDWILAMDSSNYDDLMHIRPKNCRAKVAIFGKFKTDSAFSSIVQDPYYGGVSGFEHNFAQIVHFSEEFIKQVVQKN